VSLDLPDVKGREAILKVHAKKIRLKEGANLSTIARGTPGCSGADLEAIINEAAIIATMRSHEEVAMEDLEEARDKTMFGRQKRSRVMEDQERKITAYHEAGHAVVAELQRPATEPVHKVTIIPRGMSLGSTMSLPERDRYIVPRSYLTALLAVLFGGRASEEIFFKDISHGARDDIRKATEIARAMVTEYGMSDKMGPIAFSDSQEHLFLGREITRTSHHSEETARQIDSEIRRMISTAYEKAKDLITKNREKLKKIAEALLKYETVTGEEVARMLKGEEIDAIRANASAPTA
jgi:cell division protease FtsH